MTTDCGHEIIRCQAKSTVNEEGWKLSGAARSCDFYQWKATRVASHRILSPLPLRPNWVVEDDEDVSRRGISHGAENQIFVILLRFDPFHPSLGKAQAKIAIINERTDGRTGLRCYLSVRVVVLLDRGEMDISPYLRYRSKSLNYEFVQR